MTDRTAAAAIKEFVRPGDRVLLGTAAGEALTLQSALVEQADLLPDLHLLAGIQLGGYRYLGPVMEGRWQFDSWQVGPGLRDAVDAGAVGLHPCRGALVGDLIRALRPDVFLTVVSPPDTDGRVSLGASVSYALPASMETTRVIAEVNPKMPRMHGTTMLPVGAFDALVDAEHPLVTHEAPVAGAVARRIAAHVRELIPDSATVQIGLGPVPEALSSMLADGGSTDLTLYGMGTDAMIGYLTAEDRPGAYVGGELLGTEKLFRFADDNPTLVHRPIDELMTVPHLASIDRFVSLNSAIEVDLTGQVNAEWAGARQVSAPGGSFDFVDGSWFSRGGRSIIALSATARGGTRSKIVPYFATRTPVTIPRHSVRYVVTEFGVADLWGATLRERSEALIAIADPRFHDALEAAAYRGGDWPPEA